MSTEKGWQPQGEVVIEGILQKKTPGGIRGFKPWQKRYFLVTTKAISYHKAKGEEPKGFIPILEIKKVEYLPEKRMGARFDIVSKNGRTYSLHSDCEEDSCIWVNAIRQAVLLAKQEIFMNEKKQNILEDTGKKYSTLQKMFFEAKFGVENMTKQKDHEKQEEAIVTEVERDFAKDSDVLKYLLSHILLPEKRYFEYERVDEDKNTENGFTSSSSVEEVLTFLGTSMGQNMDQCIQAFHSSFLIDIRDVMNGEIPSSVPKKISAALQRIIDLIKAKDQAAPKLLPGLQNARDVKSVEDKIAQILTDTSMVRNLVLVFSSVEVEAHGLAVRVLWALYQATMQPFKAISEFTSQIDIQCTGGRVSVSTKDALMSILLSGNDVIKDIEPIGNIGFHRKVKCPQVFGALFASLKESDYEIRKLALADITALLYENLPNCELLVNGNPWQAWMMSLLIDVPKDKKNEDPIKTCYAFLVNNVTLVHYQYFLQSPHFARVINSSMLRIHQFGGSNRECSAITNTLLGALVNKLAAQKSQFGTDYKRFEWVNLFELLNVIKRYIFQTAYWQTLPYLGLVLDKVENTEIDVLSLDAGAMHSPSPGGNEVEFDVVMVKSRPAKTDRTWNSEGVEIKDFGLHWLPSEMGPCTDVDLAKKVHTLFVKLGLDKFDPDIAQDMEKADKEFLSNMEQLAQFWEDAHRFLSLMNRGDIAKKRLFTYRRLSFLCQNFLNAETRSSRERLINQLNRLKAGQAAEDEELPRPSVPTSP